MTVKPKILLCPLDWGIGHATRSVPVIRKLLSHDCNVVLGGSGRSADFLRTEFPGLQFVKFPGFEVSYAKTAKGMGPKFIMNIPKLIKWTKKEHRLLSDIIVNQKINAVISDSRLGSYSNKIPSILIIHQLFSKAPGYLKAIEPQMEQFTSRHIGRFTECWIPDFEGNDNLSGDLSHKKKVPPNTFFIEPLSRFTAIHPSSDPWGQEQENYDVLFLLSGPEPQRSIFEKKILDQVSKLNVRSAMLSGKPGSREPVSKINGCEIYPHLPTPEMQNLILRSKLVVSRSGYSTIMDLVALGKNAVFVPTPGQTEQEYLARYYDEKGYFKFVSQEDFDLENIISLIGSLPTLPIQVTGNLLEKRIKHLISLLKETL